MQKRKKILIAVDGSRQATNALNYVANQCSPSGLEVHILSILPMGLDEVFRQVSMGEEFMNEMQRRYDLYAAGYKSEAEEYLTHCKECLLAAGFSKNHISSSIRNWREGIARDIISEARKGYDGIVLGRRGLGRIDSVLLGSVSSKIVQHLQEVPLWVIGGAVQSRKVLLAVDSSANALKAVEYAGSLLADSEAEICLCHVVRGFPPILDSTLFQYSERLQEQLQGKIIEEIQKTFAFCKECLEEAGVQADRIESFHTFGSFSRAAEILHIAKEQGFGTIIMGRRGISVVREFLMGRVTTKVLNGGQDFAVWVVP